MKKVIVRIKGGLGNQLFCYAVARRLALVNNAELVIDDHSGFVRDAQYQRTYMLGCFAIPARKATPAERLEPLERWRRGYLKLVAKFRPFPKRRYLSEEGLDFDPRLLEFKVKSRLYLDGLWLSQDYFSDIADLVRQDLRMAAPTDTENQRIAQEITTKNAVALHVRWFDVPGSSSAHNVSAEYYQRAIHYMEQHRNTPHYFLFSDNPDAAMSKLELPEGRVTCVSHNQGDANAWADLWLMTHCKNFITANSTFSWWAAWLAASTDKLVLTPDLVLTGKTAWGFKGLIPETWVCL